PQKSSASSGCAATAMKSTPAEGAAPGAETVRFDADARAMVPPRLFFVPGEGPRERRAAAVDHFPPQAREGLGADRGAQGQRVQVPVLRAVAQPAQHRLQRAERGRGALLEHATARLLPVISKGAPQTAKRRRKIRAGEPAPVVGLQRLLESAVRVVGEGA